MTKRIDLQNVTTQKLKDEIVHTLCDELNIQNID